MVSPAASSESRAMDKRIAERRAAVARSKGRRRRRIVGSVLLLAALSLATLGIGRSALFAITDVDVRGVEAERVAEVEEVAGISAGDNLIAADIAGAERAVTALPWVAEAHAARVPPTAVELDVRPRAPAANVRLAREMWVVDGEGVVLQGGRHEGAVEIEAPNSALPRTGESLSDAAIANALVFHTSLPDGLAERVARYEALSATELHMEVASEHGRPVRVRVGSSDRAELKARVITELLAQASDLLESDGPGVEELDVRAPENPVLVPIAEE